MKTSILSSFALAFAATQVNAFPAIQEDALRQMAEGLKRSPLDPQKVQKRVVFDAKSQYVSNTGAHAFIPPNFGRGDQRGPCPGLNALANHNYIPRNGVGSIQDFITGTNKAFGMALDLGAFLGLYGAVFDGNLLGYSIGGPTKNNQLPLGNLLGLTGLVGQPQGLSGSHNKYESDASPTRGDLYLYGNDYKLQVPQFQQYYDALVEGVPAGVQYDNLLDFRIARYTDSIENNPYFFYSPFAGILVSPAGYSFPVRMMANHSAEFPDGSLSKKDLMTFFAISGTPGNFKYTEGHERIPNNWYKRAIGNEFTIPAFLIDVLDHGTKYPPFLNVGGNTGTKNSFSPLDFRSLTGGVFATADLLKGNNLFCYLLQISDAAVPDILANQGAPTQAALSAARKSFSDTIVRQLASLGCPNLAAVNKAQYNRFPGAKACKEGCARY